MAGWEFAAGDVATKREIRGNFRACVAIPFAFSCNPSTASAANKRQGFVEITIRVLASLQLAASMRAKRRAPV
jgi:hypothetical protein